MSRFCRMAVAAGLVLVAACGSDGGDLSDASGGSSTEGTDAAVSTPGADTGRPAGPAPSVTGPAGSSATSTSTSTSTSGTGTTGRGTGSTGAGAGTGSEEGNGMVVRFAVEGGFANLARSVTIDGDGAVIRIRSGQESAGRLSTDEVTAIERALDGSGLFDRDRQYPAPPGAADLQRYEISYQGHTLVAYDTTVPPELNEAVALLDAATRPG